LLGLWLGGLALPAAPAQEQPAGPPPPAIILPINATQRLQMASKKNIARVSNEKDTIARVSAVPNDPTSVLITGLDTGTTLIALTDVDGKVERYQIIVQLDVEYLKTVLQRAVPEANIVPIPAANNAVILTGTLSRAEDVDVALRAAQSVVLGPDRVINALHVGGVQQVQLCVTVALVDRTKLRQFGFNFLFNDQKVIFGSTV